MYPVSILTVAVECLLKQVIEHYTFVNVLIIVFILQLFFRNTFLFHSIQHFLKAVSVMLLKVQAGKVIYIYIRTRVDGFDGD